MTLEEDLNKFNEYFFFKEFTYSKNEFRTSDNNEVELADDILFLDDIAFIFQYKERTPPPDATSTSEQKWFEKKVVKFATKQVRDTIGYLNDNQKLSIQNNKGHKINLCDIDLSKLHKIVIYKPSDLLPNECKRKKHHLSSTANLFIHFFQSDDYINVVRYLITPTEVSEYLAFRKMIIEKYPSQIGDVPENVLLGQFLSGDETNPPDRKFLKYLKALDQDRAAWDVSNLIKLFHDRMLEDDADNQYYLIIKEIAKLPRNALTEFNKRFLLFFEKASEDTIFVSRIHFPGTDCSFMFMLLPQEFSVSKNIYLQNMSNDHKYDMKSKKVIGMSFMVTEEGKDGDIDIGWCFIEGEWATHLETEGKLKEERHPFREVQAEIIPIYKFK